MGIQPLTEILDEFAAMPEEEVERTEIEGDNRKQVWLYFRRMLVGTPAQPIAYWAAAMLRRRGGTGDMRDILDASCMAFTPEFMHSLTRELHRLSETGLVAEQPGTTPRGNNYKLLFPESYKAELRERIWPQC